MTLLKEKVIGEKISTMYKIFVVALPPTNDEYLKVCPIPFPIIEGKVYYESGKITTHDVMTEEADAISKAMKFLPNTDGYKIIPTYAHGDENQRNKLLDKLRRMTRWDFYNRKY